MNAFPWLRLYNETLSDRKIARICRDAGQPKALVIGVWATLLMLASESPRRGELLISDDLPLSPDEIRDETGLDDDTFSAIVTGLSSYSLIDTSGPVWTICNWDAYSGMAERRITRREFVKNRSRVYEALVERDGEYCRHCGETRLLSVDHVRAIVNGGGNELDNLQLLCRSCNSRKGAR